MRSTTFLFHLHCYNSYFGRFGQNEMAAGTRNDVELGHIRDGYPALAAWIARDPDSETYVFRKFNQLSARNLLHLQSQIITLESELLQLDDEARRSDDYEARQSSRRWETLIKHAEDETRPERKRLALAKEIQIKLKEYRRHLTSHFIVLRLT